MIMSFLLSDQISAMQLELNTITGQMVDDSDWMLFMNRAVEYISTGYKMPTTERQHDLLLFNGVNEYALPDDFAGIIQPKRYYGNWSPTFAHETTDAFVHWPYGYTTSLMFDRESQYLVANCPAGNYLQLNNCDSLTENGAWAASGDASNLVLDTQIFVEGTGALRFTITPSSGTAVLTCTNMNDPVDISAYLTQGWLFFNPQCPNANASALTGATIRIGSDASNYYELSATTRYRGDSILNGWGLVGFNMMEKITVGSPDDTSIDYIEIGLDGGDAGTYRLDNIFIAEANYFQLPYYSRYNIKAADGTYKALITATDDTVLCPNENEFTGVFTYKTLELLNAMRMKSAAMASYCAMQLAPKEKYLKTKYRKQESMSGTTWYKRTNLKSPPGLWLS